jgi:putative spermidine/putrescine transport system permease protein
MTTLSSAPAVAPVGTRDKAPLAAPVTLLVPIVIVFALGFVAPLADLLVLAFRDSAGDAFTLQNFAKVLADPLGIRTLLDSIAISLGVAALCAVLGFPLAYQLARTQSRFRNIYLLIVTFPLLTSAVVRTFGWQALLLRNGVVSQFLELLGVEGATTLLGTRIGVVIVLAEILLPIMTLVIYGVIRNIDPAVERAAVDLGDPPFYVWIRVTIPLAKNGIIGGFLLVFSLSLSSYVTPKLIGQSRISTLGTSVYEYAMALSDYNTASVYACILLFITLGISFVAARMLTERR